MPGRPYINYKKCVQCGTCVSVCPLQVFEMKGSKVEIVHPDKCVQCRACEISCTKSAIEVK